MSQELQGPTEDDFYKWWNKLQITNQAQFSTIGETFKWAPAGFFCVHRDLIKKREKSFYQNILNTLQSPDPITGHYCERAWYYIFNPDII